MKMFRPKIVGYLSVLTTFFRLCVGQKDCCHSLNIISRSEWGARNPGPVGTISNSVPFFIIHHTDPPECSDISTCSRAVRGIQNYHMDTRKWSDIGYSFLVGGDGNVYEGRGWGKAGAHTKGYNSRSYAVSFIGSFTDKLPTEEALTAAKQLIACGVQKGKIKKDYVLRGHRDVGDTECPGDKLYMEIRKWPNYPGSGLTLDTDICNDVVSEPERGVCNPLGTDKEVCYKSPVYNKYQRGSCKADKDILQLSGGLYACAGRAEYCYYQCMLAKHHIDSGDVYDDCTCGQDVPGSSVSTPEIPSWCYNPDGVECRWYRECLEARFPCKDSDDTYALDYGEKFCKLYEDRYDKFTKKGKQWIDAVRKCLQVALVPLLRSSRNPTCEEVKTKAFASHPDCYVAPDPEDGSLSFCSLGWSDLFQVSWTVKSSVFTDFSSTIGQSLITLDLCI